MQGRRDHISPVPRKPSENDDQRLAPGRKANHPPSLVPAVSGRLKSSVRKPEGPAPGWRFREGIDGCRELGETMKEQYIHDEPLTLYLNDIKSQTYLSQEEETELARRWRDDKDAKAMERLIGSHLRLVVKMAKGMRGYDLPLADLIAE